MDREPDRKPDDRADRLPDRPGLVQQDWEALKSGDVELDAAYENGDLRYEDELDGDLPEEDDDNLYQESDAALPDESEEQAISRDLDKSGGRRGES